MHEQKQVLKKLVTKMIDEKVGKTKRILDVILDKLSPQKNSSLPILPPHSLIRHFKSLFNIDEQLDTPEDSNVNGVHYKKR